MIIPLCGFDVSMKTGLAPRGSTFTILPPAVVMAANNYYGLPQVPERIRFTVETLTKGCTRAANGGAVHCSSNCLPRPGTWHGSACWLQCRGCCLCCHLLCSSSASGTKCAACCLFGLSSGRTPTVGAAAIEAGFLTILFPDCSNICSVRRTCNLHRCNASLFLPGAVCCSLWLANSSLWCSCSCSSLLSASFCGGGCHLHCGGLDQLPGQTHVQPRPCPSGCHGGTTADSNCHHQASYFICTRTCIHLCLQQQCSIHTNNLVLVPAHNNANHLLPSPHPHLPTTRAASLCCDCRCETKHLCSTPTCSHNKHCACSRGTQGGPMAGSETSRTAWGAARCSCLQRPSNSAETSTAPLL